MLLGDLDGDGDVDMALGQGLFLNAGLGFFVDVTAARFPPGGGSSLALLDIEQDGDLDIVFASFSEQNRLYVNDGTASYADATAAHMPSNCDETHDVALGDVDGDGDLDAVFANSRGRGSHQNRLYLNDGWGTYTDATSAKMPADTDFSRAVALGDVDGDGDPDMVFANSLQQNRLYVNDSTGTYADATARMPVDVDSTRSLVMGDVDGDGDLDLVYGSTYDPNLLYLNLLHQLETPFLARLGYTYTLEVYSRFGPPSPSEFALPLLSTAAARISVPPYGTFGLEPKQMVALPALMIPQPAGMASTSFAVPKVAGIAGISLYAQVLIVTLPPAPVRLTNVTADVLIR